MACLIIAIDQIPVLKKLRYSSIFTTKLIHKIRGKTVRIQCPKCSSKKVYLLGTGKRRCARCHNDFTTHRLPLYLTKDQWKEIISWFLLEQSSQTISLRTSIERGRVLRALIINRQVLIKDIPDIFSDTVEVDETYLGGQWRNKRKVIRDQGTKRGRGQRSNQYSGSSVVTRLSGQKL